jgi:hypothetical protein
MNFFPFILAQRRRRVADRLPATDDTPFDRKMRMLIAALFGIGIIVAAVADASGFFRWIRSR